MDEEYEDYEDFIDNPPRLIACPPSTDNATLPDVTGAAGPDGFYCVEPLPK